MAHARFDLTDADAEHVGDTYTIPTTVTDGSGAAKDLTGASATYFVVKSPAAVDAYDDGDRDALVEKTIDGGGITLTDAANGELRVRVDTTDTSGLTPAEYHHRLRVTDQGGARRTVFHGTLELAP